MKNQNTKIERIIKRVVEHITDTELCEWPPQCAAFLYQPVRPQKVNKEPLKDKDDGCNRKTSEYWTLGK